MLNEENRKNGPTTAGRDAAGRFGRGNRGRPRGSRNRVTRACEKIIASDAVEVVKALVEKAKAGNVAAAIAIVRTLVGPAKERADPMNFRLPELRTPADALAAISSITAGVARGELDEGQARALVSLVDTF